MTFKTWNTNGTAATFHRTTVLNKAAEIGGLEMVKRAAQWIGNQERVTGVTANQALEYAAAFA